VRPAYLGNSLHNQHRHPRSLEAQAATPQLWNDGGQILDADHPAKAVNFARRSTGRDWYDFSWYISNGATPNITHLQATLIQAGPWTGQEGFRIDMAWLEDTLRNTIATIDWKAAADDVRRFLRPAEAKSLQLWSDRFFLAKLEKMVAA